MALWNPKASTPRPDDPVRFEQVRPARQREALAVLMTGEPDETDVSVDHFLNYLREQGGSLDDLWVALRADQILAATAILPSAGHVGMVFVSPLNNLSHINLVGDLIATACTWAPSKGAKLLQAILDPDQVPEQSALKRAGFRSLSNLVYMQLSPLRDVPVALSLENGIAIEKYGPGTRSKFEAGILKSYQETLDCPSLVGLRTIDDIIAGHMAAGEHHPELWYVLSHGEDPVGVMLLSMLPNRRSAEVVYLGLSPGYRGRGLGRRLMEFGISEVARRGARSMLLAVDDQNPPAKKLYESMRFTPYSRKHAMIMALS